MIVVSGKKNLNITLALASKDRKLAFPDSGCTDLTKAVVQLFFKVQGPYALLLPVHICSYQVMFMNVNKLPKINLTRQSIVLQHAVVRFSSTI